MKYLIFATDKDPENNISIECDGISDLVEYTQKCVQQGYMVIVEMMREERKWGLEKALAE